MIIRLDDVQSLYLEHITRYCPLEQLRRQRYADDVKGLLLRVQSSTKDPYFPLQNALWSGARPAPDAPSSPRRAGGAGSELPRRKKGRCAHRPFKVNAVYLLWKQKLSYIQLCI